MDMRLFLILIAGPLAAALTLAIAALAAPWGIGSAALAPLLCAGALLWLQRRRQG